MINFGKFEHKIQQVFGLAKTSTVKEDETFPKDPHFLRYSGYPTLNGMWLFLTLSGLKQWQTKKNLDFPNKCCVCLKKAQYFLPCYEKTGFWNLGRKIVILDDIPHCSIHGQETQAQLIATSYPLREGRVIMITLTGMNADFLTETFDLNQRGDVIPPWQAFPEYPWGSINWREGDGEFWWESVWQPFWKGLSKTEKQDYLDRQNSPREWQLYLRS